MGTTLNKKAYTELIEQNIAELEKYMPEHSLEKNHIIDILRWSIRVNYEYQKETYSNLDELLEFYKKCHLNAKNDRDKFKSNREYKREAEETGKQKAFTMIIDHLVMLPRIKVPTT